MKTLSTWLALAGLFFMSAGHSVAAECPPHMPSMEMVIKKAEADLGNAGLAYTFVIAEHKDKPFKDLFLIVKDGETFHGSVATFAAGCMLPRSGRIANPVDIAERLLGLTLNELFAEEI